MALRFLDFQSVQPAGIANVVGAGAVVGDEVCGDADGDTVVDGGAGELTAAWGVPSPDDRVMTSANPPTRATATTAANAAQPHRGNPARSAAAGGASDPPFIGVVVRVSPSGSPPKSAPHDLQYCCVAFALLPH